MLLYSAPESAFRQHVAIAIAKRVIAAYHSPDHETPAEVHSHIRRIRSLQLGRGSLQHQCSDSYHLTVFDLMMLLRECPGEAHVTLSSGEEPGINVSWPDGYFSIHAPKSKDVQ
jgi:hypothetical protein